VKEKFFIASGYFITLKIFFADASNLPAGLVISARF
jgi:hypothetical protein